jgi:pimeloyl-ACP methyl ester carboxylesterase
LRLSRAAAPLPPRPPPSRLLQGLHGQLHAVWHHRLTPSDKVVLASGAFPVLLIHGVKDKVAPASYSQRLAREVGASFALLPGAHVVMRESAKQVRRRPRARAMPRRARDAGR